jgi:N-methylhydantoinase A/oxoprolinase/acetone carboxylase beta subunit
MANNIVAVDLGGTFTDCGWWQKAAGYLGSDD